MEVTFMTAEKWVVPDPIQYKLLSLSQNGWNVNLDEQLYHRKHIHHPINLCIPQHVCVLSDKIRTPQTIC
jgi:hypothetical protein